MHTSAPLHFLSHFARLFVFVCVVSRGICENYTMFFVVLQEQTCAVTEDKWAGHCEYRFSFWVLPLPAALAVLEPLFLQQALFLLSFLF